MVSVSAELPPPELQAASTDAVSAATPRTDSGRSRRRGDLPAGREPTGLIRNLQMRTSSMDGGGTHATACRTDLEAVRQFATGVICLSILSAVLGSMAGLSRKLTDNELSSDRRWSGRKVAS